MASESRRSAVPRSEVKPSVVPDYPWVARRVLQRLPDWLYVRTFDVTGTVPSPAPDYATRKSRHINDVLCAQTRPEETLCRQITRPLTIRRRQLEVDGLALLLSEKSIVRPKPRPILRVTLGVVWVTTETRICSDDGQVTSRWVNDCSEEGLGWNGDVKVGT